MAYTYNQKPLACIGGEGMIREFFEALLVAIVVSLPLGYDFLMRG